MKINLTYLEIQRLRNFYNNILYISDVKDLQKQTRGYQNEAY